MPLARNDLRRFEIVKQLWQMMLTGNYTVPKLYDIAVNTLHLTQPATPKRPERKPLLSTLYLIFSNPFYYGWYEWPIGSGNWIQGKHEPMITESEFDRVQFILGRKGKPRPKTHKLAFTGLMHCPCGAMITGEEKFKKQKNGNVHHYIFYHCTRKINPSCTERSIEVKELHRQIDDTLAQLTIPERFHKWALHFLHEIRKTEASARETTLVEKQKKYERITVQLDNLILKYTSPENANEEIMTSEELKTVKSSLLKQKASLEDELKKQGKELGEWVELSENTFNLAHHGRIWFAEGTIERKRAIFSCLGSNLIVSNRKVSLTLKKPFKILYAGLPHAEEELKRLEPPRNAINSGEIQVFAREFPVLSGIPESNWRPILGKDMYCHYTNPASLQIA